MAVRESAPRAASRETPRRRRSRIQFWTMLRVNYLLGLHELLDYWVDAKLLDLRDSRLRAAELWVL